MQFSHLTSPLDIIRDKRLLLGLLQEDLRNAEEQLGAMQAAQAEAADSASSVLDSLLASGQLNGLIADAAESKAVSTYEAQKPALEATLKRKIDAEATKANAARLLKSYKGGGK